jgi:hypothetical protein
LSANEIQASNDSGIVFMKSRTMQLALLLVLAALMFLASGRGGSYFCISPWAGDHPGQGFANNANP